MTTRSPRRDAGSSKKLREPVREPSSSPYVVRAVRLDEGDRIGRRAAPRPRGARGRSITRATADRQPRSTNVVDRHRGGGVGQRPSNELMIEKLRRQDADDGHVVGVRELAGRRARAALVEQLRRGGRAEHAGVLERRGARDLFDPLGRRRPRTRARRARDTAASCAARIASGTRPAAASFRTCFSSSTAQLVRRRQRFGQRRDAAIEERKSALDRVRHQHPVALRRQQVAGQQRADLEVLILRQRRPARELRRESSSVDSASSPSQRATSRPPRTAA